MQRGWLLEQRHSMLTTTFSMIGQNMFWCKSNVQECASSFATPRQREASNAGCSIRSRRRRSVRLVRHPDERSQGLALHRKSQRFLHQRIDGVAVVRDR